MHPWLLPLHGSFQRHASASAALAMQAYMKGIAPFFGIGQVQRRELVKAHVASHGPLALEQLPAVVHDAFACAEREMHYTAVDLLRQHARKLGPKDLPLVEHLIVTKSWWDTVDALAVHAAGTILRAYPAAMREWNARWIESPDLWLNRTAILFQLRWKADTDQGLLFRNILRHADRKDFFIRKAIGWSLRALAETDPAAVKAFVQQHRLSPLSQREALRKIA